MKFKILVLTLSILLFTTQADAAWILWQKPCYSTAPIIDKDGQELFSCAHRNWEPIEGFEEMHKCNLRLEKIVIEKVGICANAGGDLKKSYVDGGKVFCMIPEKKQIWSYEYRCLPDTIDLRKEK